MYWLAEKFDPDIGVIVYTGKNNRSAIGGIVMKISELSRKTGVSIRSLRYYEQKKLIAAERLENGYREFSQAMVERVQAIQLYYGLGLNSEQVEKILNCQGATGLIDPNPACEGVLGLYQRKLQEVQAQMDTLLQVKSELEKRIDYIRNRHAELHAEVI